MSLVVPSVGLPVSVCPGTALSGGAAAAPSVVGFVSPAPACSQKGGEEMSAVVNLRKDRFDVYIGRGSIFGNPFRIGEDGSRDQVIAKYRVWFYEKLTTDAIFRAKVEALKDKRLGCYCKPLACHGDVIVAFLARKGVQL